MLPHKTARAIVLLELSKNFVTVGTRVLRLPVSMEIPAGTPLLGQATLKCGSHEN